MASSLAFNARQTSCQPTSLVSASIANRNAFVFQPGPVFGDVLLADELNQNPTAYPVGLLEAMSEGQVTCDGVSRQLPDGFCIATQNPLDHVGTYPLPDSQKDRFLLSFDLGYPEASAELALLASDGAEHDLARQKQRSALNALPTCAVSAAE